MAYVAGKKKQKKGPGGGSVGGDVPLSGVETSASQDVPRLCAGAQRQRKSCRSDDRMGPETLMEGGHSYTRCLKVGIQERNL